MHHFYRHVKTGNVYKVLNRDCLLEQTLEQMVVYQRAEGGTVWIRPLSEFNPIRFSPLEDHEADPEVLFDPLTDIAEFHQKFDIDYAGPIRSLPCEMAIFRNQFITEENIEWATHQQALDYELTEANVVDQGEYQYRLAEQLDALVDLAYVLFGTVRLQGMQEVFKVAWARVHRANMSKVKAKTVEESKRGYIGDVVKPAGWAAPDHSDLVEPNDLSTPV